MKREDQLQKLKRFVKSTDAAMPRTDNATNVPREKDTAILDVFIAGGGINGAVTALRLAKAGYRVALAEGGDFAGQTSQSSSNLIWGGIKYLENFELLLVRKLSASRNRLLRAYPSLVRELRFLSPHRRKDRHGLIKLYLGAWFYWLWGGMKTRVPTWHSMRSLKQTGFPINLQGLNGGFEYSDAYLVENDARFVFNFIRDAGRAGAIVCNYLFLQKAEWVEPESLREASTSTRTPMSASSASSASSTSGLWKLSLQDRVSGETIHVRSRAFINAAGPHVDGLNARSAVHTSTQHVFSKGIHLIVRRILPDRRALAFYASDGRLFFALSMGQRTCLGTTDTRVKTPDVTVSDEDRAFVLDNVNALLNLDPPLTAKDIIAERCGVRPLAQARAEGETDMDWFTLSRRHILESDDQKKSASIFGGKLTDCLNVGEEVETLISSWLPRPARLSSANSNNKWFGEDSGNDEKVFRARANNLLPEKSIVRFWRRYGPEAVTLIERLEEMAEKSGKQSLADSLAPIIPGSDVLHVEAEYSLNEELVVTKEDFLRRRTMLSLTHSREEWTNHPLWKTFDDPKILPVKM